MYLQLKVVGTIPFHSTYEKNRGIIWVMVFGKKMCEKKLKVLDTCINN